MTLAVDAGGTYLRGEIYQNGMVKKSFRDKSADIGLVAWIEGILKENEDIKTICVSFAGQVKDGVILSAPNIIIDEKNIKIYFESHFGVEFFIQNDLNCAVLAEARYFKSDDVCAIYIGTGLGLGVISSSKLISGKDGVATELGHIPYKSSPFVCGCGKKNCLELFCSGIALKNLKNYYDLDENLTLKELKNMHSVVYTEFEKALLYSVAITITLFNPEVLVLGGGIIQNNPDLLEIVKLKIKEYAMGVSLKNLKIEQTRLENASLSGAMLKEI